MSEVKLKNCPFCDTKPSVSAHLSPSGEKIVYCDNIDCAIWGDKCLLSRWQIHHDSCAELVEMLSQTVDALTYNWSEHSQILTDARILLANHMKGGNCEH